MRGIVVVVVVVVVVVANLHSWLLCFSLSLLAVAFVIVRSHFVANKNQIAQIVCFKASTLTTVRVCLSVCVCVCVCVGGWVDGGN